jgi:glycine cleavage system pyridoxal-binding protein P
LKIQVWYHTYTPYQAEITQGRLEAILNFKLMVIELTRFKLPMLPLLDESTRRWKTMAHTV